MSRPSLREWFARRVARSGNPLNEFYIEAAPSPQNALDVFAKRWLSKFPPPFDALRAGETPLFQDARIEWLISALAGVRDLSVLELGPLEAGHTYMLEQAGARSVTAIEANTASYLRCLVAKEILGMQRVRFLCGDFMAYLREPSGEQFDVAVASGVLYHMINPAELIALLAQRTRRHLYLWTHYFDDDWLRRQDRPMRSRFSSPSSSTYGGFSYRLVRQDYGRRLRGKQDFCGGTRAHSQWMYRDDILACLEHFGFGQVRINFEQRAHEYGPSFALIATRE